MAFYLLPNNKTLKNTGHGAGSFPSQSTGGVRGGCTQGIEHVGDWV